MIHLKEPQTLNQMKLIKSILNLMKLSFQLRN